MEDKVIVTHRGALAAKYGSAGLAKIKVGITALITKDRTRGIKTLVVYLDDAAQMKKYAGKPLTNVADCRSAKKAIDAVHKALQPDYLMILGATDVIPHQDLKNPAYGAGDDDPIAWGDLPYACDAPYDRDPARFIGPTRVISRLPDLTGATEPSHLLALLKTAENWKSRKLSDYTKYFGLSAAVWQGSTSLSLDNIFGNNANLMLAPPTAPNQAASKLAVRAHFINCHGATASSEFYGQKGRRYPTSLSTAAIQRKIVEGTVAAVECCYGGQLYDSVIMGLDMPICQSYLRQEAYGYLGSTTIAYGPADTNGAADWVCQFFLLNILEGASVGRAALMARQQFVQRCAQMDAMDLKTLAQFCIYGDPSVHPVGTKPAPKLAGVSSADESQRFARGERRAKMKQTGEFLLQTKLTASRSQKIGKLSATTRSALANLAVKAGMPPDQQFVAFPVKGAAKAARKGKLATAPTRYLLAIYNTEPSRQSSGQRVAVVAKELDGRIIDYCIYHQR